eukprot:4030414-Pyramimonas_sp.AAC.1
MTPRARGRAQESLQDGSYDAQKRPQERSKTALSGQIAPPGGLKEAQVLRTINVFSFLAISLPMVIRSLKMAPRRPKRVPITLPRGP